VSRGSFAAQPSGETTCQEPSSYAGRKGIEQ
jgi:hypothetical protein